MTSRARVALSMIALMALIAVVYAPVQRGVFVWDDHALVETSPLVQRGSLADIFGQPFWTANALSDGRPLYYRPVTMLTFRGDFAMAGAEPSSFHVTNLAIHVLAALALVLVARKLGAPPIASLLAAAVWAVHPRTTEAVAWISGRGDLLAGLIAIVAVGLWPWYGDAAGEAREAREVGVAKTARGERLRAGLASVAVLVGLLAKEVAFAAVVAIVVGTALGTPGEGRDRWRRVAQRLVWIAPPLVVYVALRLFATRGATGSHLTPLGLGLRSATVLEAIGRYVEMTFDPWHPATSIGLVGEIDTGSVVLGVIAIAFVAAVAVRAAVRRRRAPRAALSATTDRSARAVLGALGALGATSLGLVVHVVPIGLAAAVAADRLLYLPLAALALAVAVGSARLPTTGRRALGVAAVALAVSFAPVTRARATDYTDELTFRVVASEHAHPDNTSPKSSLANMLRADAETALACRLHASVRGTLERTARTKTQRYIRALENLGGCYAALGRYEDADSTYAVIERLEPKHARAHMELGYLRLHTFDIDRAEVEFRRALELDATLEPARASLAALPKLRAELARLGSEPARQADPVGWARLLMNLGRTPDATAAWARIVMDPETDGETSWQGVEYLLSNADIATARRATEAGVTRHIFAAELGSRWLARRVKQQARIDALRPRIEALVASEERAGSSADARR